MSGIIKADGNSQWRSAVRPATFQFDDVPDQAGDSLDQACRPAKASGEQQTTAAVQSSLRAECETHLETLIAAIEKASRAIEQSKQAWLAHWEKSAVRLAVAIAERIARRELSRSPEITLGLVREALELAAGSARVQLRLNPQDHQALADQAQRLAESIGELGTVEILADQSITAGGCRVDTEFGRIDQQLETQLARIEEELT